MNPAQHQALRMLREDPRRDLYETADPRNTKVGSGEFMVTYSDGKSPKLTQSEVGELLRCRLIEHKWPDKPHLQCFVLPGRDGEKP